jgi:ABC-type phosphate/phosphonate transport system substrate-binding protein
MGNPMNHIARSYGAAKPVMCTLLMLANLLAAYPAGSADHGPEPLFVLAYSMTMFYEVEQKDATAALAVWSKEIGREKGYSVESSFYENSAKLAEDLTTGKVDFAVFRADEYARLNRKLDFDLGMTVVKGGKKTQRFFVFVRSESPYQGIKDMRNKTLSLAKGDTMGSLYLDNLLLKQKLPEKEKYFSMVHERAKASQALLAVYFGQSDLCVINEKSYEILSELNPQVRQKLRVIGMSPDLVLGVGIFRNDLRPEDKKVLQTVILTIGDTPRGRQVLTLFRTERFELIEPSDLATVRTLIAENNKLRAMR